ncbi:MAG: ABC transporter ATP-binding protein [Ardenticatenaceae bacterium]|nr:ABC transporter ATP-binding protein [Ardenticatenaceae bacterium]
MNQSTSEPFDLKVTVTTNRYRGLWRMITGYRLTYVLATVSIGLAAVANTAFYYLLRYFTDDVLTSDNLRQRVPLVALGFVGIALLQGLFTFLSGRWAAQTAEGITRRLRDYLYDHIQRLSFGYHDKTPTGELIQRVTSDVDALRLFFAEQAIGAGRIVFLFVVNFVAIAVLNLRLALISVVVIPVILIVSVLFFKKISERYERFQEQEAKLSTTLQENLSGIRVVKAFARQQYEIDKFEADNQERYQRGKRLLMMHAIYWPSTDIVSGAQLLTGYLFGATMAIQGTISIGTYLAYMGMLGWIIWPMRNLGRLIVQMSMGLVSFGRVTEIIKEDRERLDSGTYQPTGPLRGDLVFEDVSFAYDKDTAVLQLTSVLIRRSRRWWR